MRKTYFNHPRLTFLCIHSHHDFVQSSPLLFFIFCGQYNRTTRVESQLPSAHYAPPSPPPHPISELFTSYLSATPIWAIPRCREPLEKCTIQTLKRNVLYCLSFRNSLSLVWTPFLLHRPWIIPLSVLLLVVF